MSKGHEFVERLSKADLDGAADFVEEYAKQLANDKVSSTPIRKLVGTILSQFDPNNKVETTLIKSEILKLNVPDLSQTLATLVSDYPYMLDRLRKIIKAFSNFYAYYSGEGLD